MPQVVVLSRNADAPARGQEDEANRQCFQADHAKDARALRSWRGRCAVLDAVTDSIENLAREQTTEDRQQTPGLTSLYFVCGLPAACCPSALSGSVPHELRIEADAVSEAVDPDAFVFAVHSFQVNRL